MPKSNWNVSWLSLNSQRAYPLAEDASRLDITGQFQLPNSFIVSLYLAVPIVLAVRPASFLISTIQAYATGYAVTVGYDTGSGIVPAATASILRSSHVPNSSYILRGLGDFYDAGGQIVIGDLSEIDLQPPGQWNFNLAGGRLEVDAVRPQLRGVTRLRIQNGNDLSDPIVGDVIIRAGANMRITRSQVGDDDPVLTFDAISGEGLNEDCVCEGDTTLATPIRTINRIPPTSEGDFTLLGSFCVNIDPLANGLKLTNTCSDPCCGCKDLQVVTDALKGFSDAANTLQNFLTNLEARVTQMDQVVLGSKLGDQGCSSC